jgi:subtilisin family serine protease
MKSPLLLAAVLMLSPAAPLLRAQSHHATKPSQPLPPVTDPAMAPGKDEEPKPKPVPPTANAATKALLAKIGWKAIQDEAVVRLAGPDKGYIPGNYLKEADLEWKNGDLAFIGGDPLTAAQMPMIFEGLWIFVQAAKMPAIDAGKALAAMGLPPVIDGRKLVDPDGTATYYGQMLRLIYAEKPDALKRAGAERLSQALDLLHHARDQAFDKQSPDVAKTDVDRAKLMLFAPPRPGETPFGLTPYEGVGEQLAGYKARLEDDVAAAEKAGDLGRAKDSAAALEVVNTLERQRYHAKATLPAVPKPGQAAPEAADEPDPEDAPVNAPLASGLPRLLKVLDRINGTPLTSAQQENLIKSFPMGDLVWQLRAQDLWAQGLTGRNVKVAVIDSGIGRHDELADAVRSRTNFTADRGKALTDDHGTHVAGIIHALAPDAEIRGYTVFTNDAGNPLLKEGTDEIILNAIDRAVKDGNRIISMSLGGGSSPSEALARKVEEYSKKGIIFVVAAGNEHDKNSVEAPSVAPDALTVGALDGAGRPADFSSYGANFDARKGVYVVKKIFMLRGTNVYSTVVGPNGESKYQLMDGTSMATPALSGMTALLVQAAETITPNPVELSARVRDALAEGSTPLSLDKLPSNAPFDQPFLVVQPMAALDALRRQAAPATVGSPKKKVSGSN